MRFDWKEDNMKMYFEEADKLARKTLDAGHVGRERPCDCIMVINDDGAKGAWIVNGCDCGNYDDARYAQEWCCIENAVVKVRKLILELTK